MNSTSTWRYVVGTLAFVIGFGLGTSACIDEKPYVPSFTEFVIDLVNNRSDDQKPVAYEDFKDLPDPDGDTNNTAAYDSLFR